MDAPASGDVTRNPELTPPGGAADGAGREGYAEGFCCAQRATG